MMDCENCSNYLSRIGRCKFCHFEKENGGEERLNFTVVDGDRDYLNCKDEFVELYNGRSCTVPELIEKLGITINEYKLLRDECARENLVVLRQRGGNTRRKRNE